MPSTMFTACLKISSGVAFNGEIKQDNEEDERREVSLERLENRKRESEDLKETYGPAMKGIKKR